MITKKIFNDLAIYMIGFGVFIGIIFPFFAYAFGVDRNIAFSWKFIAACIIAGAVVGTVNIALSRAIVAKRLKILTGRMKKVQDLLQESIKSADLGDCTPEKCHIPVDSFDEIGESAHAFNCLVDALSDSISSQRSLLAYTELLTSKLELKDLTQKALAIILDSIVSAAGVIFIEKEGEILPIETSRIKDTEHLRNHPLLLECFKTAKQKILPIPQDIIIDGLLVDFQPKAVLVQPLIYNKIPIGVILLASITEYDEETITRIKMFSQSLSLALHNAIIHEQMQKLATIDPLTGFINRRYGLIRLKEEYSRAIRSKNALGLIMFDIDHFKRINDNYGHIAGDKVLVHLASSVKDILREGDIAMRYGGEEFCAILPGASLNDTFQIAERIRFVAREIETHYLDYTIKLTLSLGISSTPEHEVKSEQDLLQFADEALYTSKQKGRDMTTIR
jgi:two-component system, cell cycle response regulator